MFKFQTAIACALVGSFAAGLLGCAAETERGTRSTAQALANRAYIVARDSDELTVIDLDSLEIVGQLKTAGQDNHMAELNADFTKIYIDSAETHETIVIDAEDLEIIERVEVGTHPTHLSLAADRKLMFIMAEDDNTISILDTESDRVIKTLGGFNTPHFAHFDAAGRYAYVANIGAHHITRVDMKTLEIDSHIVLDGFYGPPEASEAPGEGGFADAQIDQDGMLYAAHNATGRVLMYDTIKHKKFAELAVGANPWMVYAKHPFAGIEHRYVVPNFGDESASVIDAKKSAVIATLPVGDRESFGVNYSPRAPDQAFLMNRFKQEIAVLDTQDMGLVDQIDVGGTTETAATSADGKYIVAAVSSANAVVVIDAAKRTIVRTFTDVGKYPWSVTIPNGQNYCH
jgi:DNA-binding beta-propeller fold protein YncE